MSGAPPARPTGAKLALFAALVAVCAAVGIAYVIQARSESPRSGRPTQATIVGNPETLAEIMREPHVLFRNTDLGPNFGRVEIVPLSDPDGPRVVTPLTCDRVAMAGDVGVCSATKVSTFATYSASIFDPTFATRSEVPLPGPPNRVRVSPDGHWATITSFVHGDSYADANFSTRAAIVDTTTGRSTGNLEQFRVTQNGHVVGAINRNYWGVTFAADSDHFYATQAVGADIRMIAGRRSAREAHTVKDDVECPSLSPDQTRVAYKKRSGGGLQPVRWRLHVLDLRTGSDHALAETRSIDDQVEWLDNAHVLYSIPRPDSGAITDVWSVPAAGSGPAEVFISGASSPSVSRGR
jgi:hypothetical protein